MLGSPIGHSLSPLLHRAAYVSLDLDWEYTAVEMTEGGLRAFLDGLDTSWRGLSLTMPLKRAVLPLLHEVSGTAALAGAANTVVLDGGRRHGHNTDVPGASAALRERYGGPVRRAAVLGGGATAASVLLALADLGCTEATLHVRDPARAAQTVAAVSRHAAAPRLDVRLLADPPGEVDVLVSTVPAAAQTPNLVSAADRAGVVFEVVYDPWPTPLAAVAQHAGVPLVSGHDLLLHQAYLQVELMTGLPAPQQAMRDALR